MNSVLVLLYTLSKCESKNCLNSSLKEWFLGWQVHAILAKIELQEYQDLHVMDTIEWPTCITVAGFFQVGFET